MRFVRTFGVSFVWAIVVGFVLGGTAYLRLERRELTNDPRWHVAPRLFLEQLEWRTVDWRARELAGQSERSDEVVLVTIDDETMRNAQEASRPEWAMRPWPREVLGQVAAQAIAEGAALVVIDETFEDVSARYCAPCRGESGSDDQRFGDWLLRLGPRVIIGVHTLAEPPRPPERPLLPLLVRLGEFDDETAALPLVRRVLMQRLPAYLARRDARFEVWAAVADEARAREVSVALDAKTPLVTRGLSPADDPDEVTREGLAQRLIRAQLEGLSQARGLSAGTLDAPVAAALAPSVGLAAIDLFPDADGVVRQVPLVVRVGRTSERELPVPSVSLLALAHVRAQRRVEFDAGSVLLGASRLPIDAAGLHSLHWDDDEAGRTGRGTLKRSVPAWRLLVNREDDVEGRGLRRHDNELTGRVVVLTDERRSPRFQTPVGTLSRGAIWGQAIADALRAQGNSRVNPETDFWLTMAFAFAGALLSVAWSSLVRRPGWLAWVATIGIVFVVHALVARQLYVTQLRQVAVVIPVIACAITFLGSLGYARTLERSLRDFVLRALGSAVRADVFTRVQRDLALMRPERRELTVYFSDIEGFTAVSDQQDPAVVVEVLRQYLTEMTTVVLDRGGHVDKYLGDGMMAFWGAPVSQENDAASACTAALEMLVRFEKRRAEWEGRCGRPILLRAGLDTGECVVGEMGTVHRINYTVMGEPVAAAFRLEALAKKYGVRLLVSEHVFKAAGDAFVFRSVDTVRLGRVEEPVHLFELLGTRKSLGAAEWIDAWEAAHGAFRARRFAEALEGFARLRAERPDDVLVERYLARCRRYVEAPPPGDWDGVTDDTRLS
jgi:adenylate cyclase